MSSRTLLHGLVPLLFTLAAVGCAPATNTPNAAGPALWKLADADTTIYLFGTIHILPRDLRWSSTKIDAAIAASDALMLETLLDSDPQKTAAILMRLGQSPGLPPLLTRVAGDKRAGLQRAIEKSGVPMIMLDGLETWAAALTLASGMMRDLPGSTEFGAEAVLKARFAKAGKPVSGLETPTEQLGYFDTLPESAQRIFLTSIAEDTSDPRAEFDAMVAAWRAGDVAKIALTFDDELKLSPELSDALLKRRNARWVTWMQTRMAQPGTVFMAVGAGHLAGDDAVQAMLTAKGVKVVRLQ